MQTISETLHRAIKIGQTCPIHFKVKIEQNALKPNRPINNGPHNIHVFKRHLGGREPQSYIIPNLTMGLI